MGFIRGRAVGAVVASCPKCYALLPSGATVCPSCGTAIAPAVAPGPPFARRPASAPPAPPVGAPAGSAGPWAPSTAPSVPLFPGEPILGRYVSSVAAQSRVARRGLYVVVGIVTVITVPFFFLILLTGPNVPNPLALIMLFPIVLILGTLGLGSRNRGPVRPTSVFLTDRRIIVERYAPQLSSAAMGLETLGDVRFDTNARAARNAGVCWVYLLPMGTTEPLVGGGRYRIPAPGVIWIPALPTAEAQDLRSRALAQAQQVRARMSAPMPPPPP